jgi:uncharacterized protein YbaA (DUF1428 family)
MKDKLQWLKAKREELVRLETIMKYRAEDDAREEERYRGEVALHLSMRALMCTIAWRVFFEIGQLYYILEEIIDLIPSDKVEELSRKIKEIEEDPVIKHLKQYSSQYLEKLKEKKMIGEKCMDEKQLIKIYNIAKKLSDAVNTCLIAVINYASARQEVDVIVKLNNFIDVQINLRQQLRKHPENILVLFDELIEVLLLIVEYAEKRDILLLPNLGSLIDEAVQLLEELPPHLQHHIRNTQRFNRRITVDYKVDINSMIHLGNLNFKYPSPKLFSVRPMQENPYFPYSRNKIVFVFKLLLTTKNL